MKERLGKHKRNLIRAGKLAGTTGMSTVALMAGAGQAKAAPEQSHQQIAFEAIQNSDQRVPIAELTAQTQEKLNKCQDNYFLRGSVVIVDRETGKSKLSIKNPVLAPRNWIAKKSDWDHLRSGYWAIGYMTRPKEGEEGGPKVVILPVNNNGNNFVFNVKKTDPNIPAIDVFKCNLGPTGRPDITHPLNVIGEPINDPSGHPLEIGLGVPTSGYLNLPPAHK